MATDVSKQTVCVQNRWIGRETDVNAFLVLTTSYLVGSRCNEVSPKWTTRGKSKKRKRKGKMAKGQKVKSSNGR